MPDQHAATRAKLQAAVEDFLAQSSWSLTPEESERRLRTNVANAYGVAEDSVDVHMGDDGKLTVRVREPAPMVTIDITLRP